MAMDRLARFAMVAWILVGGTFFIVVRPLLAQSRGMDDTSFHAPSAEALTERVQTLSSEVGKLRDLNVDSRLRLVEDTVVEVRWLGRTIIAVLLGQILLGIRMRFATGEGVKR